MIESEFFYSGDNQEDDNNHSGRKDSNQDLAPECGAILIVYQFNGEFDVCTALPLIELGV